MPVERVRGEAAFLAAIARFAPYLFAHHVSQHHQALFSAPFFRVIEMVVHQFVEDAHRRMTLQLTGNINLCSITPFVLFDDIRQHQLGCGPGVFFNTAAQESHPLVLLIKLLIAGLQHFQRFADQLFVLIDNAKQALHALA